MIMTLEEGTLKQAISKRALERGLLIEVIFLVDYANGKTEKLAIYPITEQINAIVWPGIDQNVLKQLTVNLQPIENFQEGSKYPLICISDYGISGLGLKDKISSIKTMKIKVLYPDASIAEKSFNDVENVAAIGWTDDMVKTLNRLLVSPEHQPSLDDLWNPSVWRERPTFMIFRDDGRHECHCKCLDCQIVGACSCGQCPA